MAETPTLPVLIVWYKYIQAHAIWKVQTLEKENGNQQKWQGHPTQELGALRNAVAGDYPQYSIEMRLDIPCERLRHRLKDAMWLQASMDLETVFCRCACGAIRQVPVAIFDARKA